MFPGLYCSIYPQDFCTCVSHRRNYDLKHEQRVKLGHTLYKDSVRRAAIGACPRYEESRPRSACVPSVLFDHKLQSIAARSDPATVP
ncbi:hypothetical protein LshimejAT787_0404460 [Lyophyllum shimeji]|uniref:Uncharacterized protein n=1 Tax=Lyophyllum shimeji TaxID=47721 RepID=A0A9P3PJJ7_LYOSH|nr:hypothetical protein LshimejAT787_0404460 [Lyophyllum shimeji]